LWGEKHIVIVLASS